MNTDDKIIEVLKFYAQIDNYLFNKDNKGVVIPEEKNQSLILLDLGLSARNMLEELSRKDE